MLKSAGIDHSLCIESSGCRCSVPSLSASSQGWLRLSTFHSSLISLFSFSISLPYTLPPCLGHNQISEMGYFINNTNVFLIFLEAGISKFKAESSSLSAEGLLYIIELGVVPFHRVEVKGKRKGHWELWGPAIISSNMDRSTKGGSLPE